MSVSQGYLNSIPQTGQLKTNLFPHSSGGWKCEIHVSTELFLPKDDEGEYTPYFAPSIWGLLASIDVTLACKHIILVSAFTFMWHSPLCVCLRVLLIRMPDGGLGITLIQCGLINIIRFSRPYLQIRSYSEAPDEHRFRRDPQRMRCLLGLQLMLEILTCMVVSEACLVCDIAHGCAFCFLCAVIFNN